jgi:hypothetical protein
MPPKAKPKATPPVVTEHLVEDNEAHFGITWQTVQAFADGHRTPKAQLLNGYLNPDTVDTRYVVISVDPAGGGILSEEAFVVWLVQGVHFTLFSGRTVKGHKAGYTFSTIPLMFVVSLLETISKTKEALRLLQRGIHKYRTRPFRMPTVLVVLETNYAYGAAVYMQFIYFLDQRKAQMPGLKDVSIVFATPVYMWNTKAAETVERLKQSVDRLKDVHVRHTPLRSDFTGTQRLSVRPDQWSTRRGQPRRMWSPECCVTGVRVTPCWPRCRSDHIRSWAMNSTRRSPPTRKSIGWWTRYWRR